MAEARIDKWMWAVRIFKTRTIAAEACKKGRVTMNGSQIKAARMVKPGDVIQVKKPPITYSFKVLQTMSKISGFIDRAHGTGRPTKKDRRNLEEFTTPEFMDDFDFEFDFDSED